VKVLGWRLHILMAERGLRFGADLHRAIVKAGYPISYRHIARLVAGKIKQPPPELLAAVCEVLNCTMADLMPLEDAPDCAFTAKSDVLR
jgi:DNA-binding Xre family transcriptional regulator